jgi:hypothetical protein
MYSPIDLSMQHRLRWQEHFDSLNKDGIIPEYENYRADADENCQVFQALVEQKAARYGEHFYVEKSIQDLVMSAERSMPEDIEFDMSWMLAPLGWLELAEPIHVGTETLSIIAWTRIIYTDKPPDAFVFPDASDAFVFGFLSYTPSEESRQETACAVQGTSLANWQERGGVVVPSYEIRFLFALMHILSQRIALPVSTEIRHNIRGQAVARGIDAVNRAKIIVLRRAEQYMREGHGSRHEYHCRFLVVGHWRQQPYPSEDVVRSIFIESYIKGPADKPLKQPSAKIFVARR